MKTVFPDGIDPGKHVKLKVGSLTLRCLVLGRWKDRVQLHSYAHRMSVDSSGHIVIEGPHTEEDVNSAMRWLGRAQPEWLQAAKDVRKMISEDRS